jgi:hypothetical protein
MKIRYLNGEKVCVIEKFYRFSSGKKHNKSIEVYNYNEVVEALNHIFKLAEVSEVPSREYGDSMDFALADIAETCNLKVRQISTVDHEVIFDDEINIKKTKQPRLRLPKYNNSPIGEIRGLKVIDGGKSLTR